jgi:hypothetical protein
MKSIAFFGASITEQKKGYVYYFSKFNSNYKILQFGYGGMYLRDAGICFIDNVIFHRPNFCFIDFFGACLSHDQIQKYLDVIVYKLFSINCHPIFLFFYRQNMTMKHFSMFNYVKNYASKYNINCIDLSKLANADMYLRDTTHTNDLGSNYYAEIINQKFHNMTFKKNDILPPLNKLTSINCSVVNIEAHNYIILYSNGCSKIIGVLQKIGPYTENVNYYYNNDIYTLMLKDRWSCRYERTNIKSGICDFCGELKIEIPAGSKLIWQKIFYTGDEVLIKNYL